MKHANKRVLLVILIGLIPYGLLAFLYFGSPGFIVPLMNGHGLAWLFFMLWEAVGVVLLGKAKTFPVQLLVAVLFIVPLALFFVIGPLCVTIVGGY